MPCSIVLTSFILYHPLSRNADRLSEKDHPQCRSGVRPFVLSALTCFLDMVVGSKVVCLHLFVRRQNGRARPVDLFDDLEHLLNLNRCQARQRLIQKQYLRSGHKPAPDGRHLQLAAGQLPTQPPSKPRKLVKDRKDAVKVFLDLTPGRLLCVGTWDGVCIAGSQVETGNQRCTQA